MQCLTRINYSSSLHSTTSCFHLLPVPSQSQVQWWLGGGCGGVLGEYQAGHERPDWAAVPPGELVPHPGLEWPGPLDRLDRLWRGMMELRWQISRKNTGGKLWWHHLGMNFLGKYLRMMCFMGSLLNSTSYGHVLEIFGWTPSIAFLTHGTETSSHGRFP